MTTPRLGPREGDCRRCSSYREGGCIENHDPGWPHCGFVKAICSHPNTAIYSNVKKRYGSKGILYEKLTKCLDCGAVVAQRAVYEKFDKPAPRPPQEVDHWKEEPLK